MKANDIFKGQVYITTMEDRFSSKVKALSPIKILAHEAGFVIFKRDGHKQAVETNSFISTFIKACKYKLKNKDFEYRGYLVIWDEGVYNVGMPASCCGLTVAETKRKIDEFIFPPEKRTQCKPSFKLSNGDTLNFNMKHIIKCSSGKDSEASIWWAYHNLPFEDWEVIFDDTEWESEEVYKHLKYLESRTGKTFINLRATRFEGKNSQEILDKIIEIFGHRSIFAEMVLSRGRFPSTKGRFCTEELKIWPTIDYILDNIKEDVVIVQGVRAEESESRRNLNERDEYFKFYFEPFGKDKNGKDRYHYYRKHDVIKHCDQYTVDVLRPILKLTHQQVFDIIFENDSPGNKLYYQGFKRVGCFPCINSGLGEVLQIAINYPERIRQIRELEKLADSTFFTIGDIPPRFCSIKRTVNVYRQDLIKLFGKKSKKLSPTGDQKLFDSDIKNPEEHLYQIWFKNDKIPVYVDDDGDEFILRNVRCPTIDDVVSYALKNPDQVNLFNKTGGCVSVYSICEVNPIIN